VAVAERDIAAAHAAYLYALLPVKCLTDDHGGWKPGK
jgi:hypothetical protein